MRQLCCLADLPLTADTKNESFFSLLIRCPRIRVFGKPAKISPNFASLDRQGGN